jgi:hypothetical protein
MKHCILFKVHQLDSMYDARLCSILFVCVNQIPSVTYVKNRGVVLRYFSPSMVSEFVIPASELRRRDPKTGVLYAIIHHSPFHHNQSIDKQEL